jgi:hypothetical protein
VSPVYTALTCQWVYMSEYVSLLRRVVTMELFHVAISLQTCVQEVLGLYLSRDTDYHDWGVPWVLKDPPGRNRDSTPIKLPPCPSKSLPIHQSSYYSKVYRDEECHFWDVAPCSFCVNRRFGESANEEPACATVWVCSNLLTLVSRSQIFLTWRWRR